MDIKKLQQSVVDALRNRELTDDEIAALTPEQAFNEYCRWNSLGDWGPTLTSTLDNLRAASAPAQEQTISVSPTARMVARLREGLKWAMDWIDAVPAATPLPTMPGFDRDYVNQLLDPSCDPLHDELEAAEPHPHRSLAIASEIEPEPNPADLSASTSGDNPSPPALAKAPSYPATIELVGSELNRMYDDQAGLYYSVAATRHHELPVGISLEDAMRTGLAILTAQEELEDREAAADREYEGQFSAKSIIVNDQYGKPLQEYSNHLQENGLYATSWLLYPPEPSQWPEMEARAKELNSEGRVESGWDNHETAKRLWAQAATLLRQIEIAKTLSTVNGQLPNFTTITPYSHTGYLSRQLKLELGEGATRFTVILPAATRCHKLAGSTEPWRVNDSTSLIPLHARSYAKTYGIRVKDDFVACVRPANVNEPIERVNYGIVTSKATDTSIREQQAMLRRAGIEVSEHDSSCGTFYARFSHEAVIAAEDLADKFNFDFHWRFASDEVLVRDTNDLLNSELRAELVFHKFAVYAYDNDGNPRSEINHTLEERLSEIQKINARLAELQPGPEVSRAQTQRLASFEQSPEM